MRFGKSSAPKRLERDSFLNPHGTSGGETLETLCAERPQRTRELFRPNDFYGNASVLKKFCGLPDDFIIHGIIPHGAKIASKVWDVELVHPLPTFLLWSAQQEELYARFSDKAVHLLGAPLFYAQQLLGSELAERRRQAQGTLVFPTHSTHHLTAQFDESEFIAVLRGLPEDLQPLRVCLYWRDVQLGRHRSYQEAGFECVSAGHMFDREFLFRLARLLAGHRVAVANRMGSAVLYAAAGGLPVKLFPQTSTYHGNDPRLVAELAPRLDLPVSEDFYQSMKLPQPEVVAVQRRLADEALGTRSVRSASNLRSLFERLIPGGLSRIEPQADPRSSELARVVGEAVGHLNAGRYTIALEGFDQARGQAPEFLRIDFGRALALARLGRAEEARSILTTLVNTAAGGPKAQMLLDELNAAP